MNSAVVMGVGPDRGMGAQLCHRAAADGHHVFVAGRTAAKVEAVAAAIREGGGQATAVTADATVEADTVGLFETAAASGRITLAIFNAGNNMPGPLADMDADYFEQCWRIACFGGFVFGREAAKHMKGQGGGSILFTGASASLRGNANFGAFAAAKAGLRAMAQSLAKELGPDHIHVGHVVIDGAIKGEKVQTMWPEYAEKLGAAGMIDIEAIVDAYQYLWRQPPGGWTFEVDVRTAIESW